MDDRKLAAICRHELLLVDDKVVARLIREVRKLQDDSNDIYAMLIKDQRINAREIMSGIMLAWTYVEGLDDLGPGQRFFWQGKVSHPDALIWPKDKKKIVAGVEKLFIELQDYSKFDRQKRESRATPKVYNEADAGENPSPPAARSTIRLPTKQGRRRDVQIENNATPGPSHPVPIAQDTKLGEGASGQKEGPKKVASKGFHNAEPSTQLVGSITDESTKESPSRKRALTPPYIPEKGLHQTRPAFGYKNVSQEGARALRSHALKIDNSEQTPRTNPVMPLGSKTSSVKANPNGVSGKKGSSILPAERSEGSHIDTPNSTPILKGRVPSLPNSLLTRGQAAKAIDSGSPALEDNFANREASLSIAPSSNGPAVAAIAVQRSQASLAYIC